MTKKIIFKAYVVDDSGNIIHQDSPGGLSFVGKKESVKEFELVSSGPNIDLLNKELAIKMMINVAALLHYPLNIQENRTNLQLLKDEIITNFK